MEVMSEKTRCNGEDKKGRKKTTKVELNLGKNGGIFILLGGALVTALLSSAFRKQRKPRDKDENHQGSPVQSTAAAVVAPEEGDEEKSNISDDEDPVRKGLQFILSDPSSLMQGHLRIKGEEGDSNVSKEMNETVEKDDSVLEMQESEEQDSPANVCHQEIISNGSSIPGSTTSSEQEYSSQDFRVMKAMKAALEEEVKEMADVVPDEQEEMECSEKNCSTEMQRNDDEKSTNSEQVITSESIHLEDCEINVQNLDLAAFHVPLHIENSNEVSTTTKESDSNDLASGEQNLEEDIPITTIQFVVKQHCNDYCKGGVSMADEKALGYSSMEKEGEEVAASDEEEINPNIQFELRKDGYTGKKYPILPSNDKEGDEETDDGDDEYDYDDERDYNDGDDDISEEMEESSEGGMISSDESDESDGEIWPAEPVQSALMGLKVPKEEIEVLKTEGYINFKTINSSKLQTSDDCRGDLKMNFIQTSARKLVILDNLATYTLQSKQRIFAGTVTLLIAYSCFWYFDLPFLKPSLVVIAAMFLSKVLAL